MIAVWLLSGALNAGLPAGSQDEADTSAPPAESTLDASRAAALRRDPRLLPRAASGRWKDFGAPGQSAGAVPEEIGEAREALAQRDVPAALAALYRVLECEPDYPPALHELGVLYFRLQRYGDSACAFERFLTQLPERVGETRALGHCYYSLGQYDKARAHYERVLEREPRMVEALRGLALSMLRLGEPARALELLQQLLEIEPRHADALTWVAQIQYDAEELDAAIATARRARDLDPSQARPWFLIGRIESELGHVEDARAAQRRFERLQEAAQSIRTLDARLLVHPHDVTALEQLVELHRSTGSVPRTRLAIARWSAERPGSRDVMLHALDVLDGLDDREGASAAAEALARRFGDDAAVWKRLESFYGRIGDRVRQVEAGERLRRLLGR